MAPWKIPGSYEKCGKGALPRTFISKPEDGGVQPHWALTNALGRSTVGHRASGNSPPHSLYNNCTVYCMPLHTAPFAPL